MEHSALHALQLTGLIIALGGALFVLGILQPSLRRLNAAGSDGGPDERTGLAESLEASAARWTARAALAGAGATLLDFFVQVAEAQGKTIFGGAAFADVIRFVTETTVGNLGLLRVAALLATAAVAPRLVQPARGASATRSRASLLRWTLAGVFSVAALLATAMVSHAAAQPDSRGLGIASQIAHIAAGAAWIGVLAHLALARRYIAAAHTPEAAALTAEVVRRFSPVALTAAGLLFLSGAWATWRFLVTPHAAITSAYGLTLIVKLTLLLMVLAAGYINFRVVRPDLLAAIGNPRLEVAPLLARFARMLELEFTAGVLVIAVAGIVGSVSPPREEAGVLLSPAQAQALLRPDLPTTRLIKPGEFYGAPTRTLDDLRYSEFTHNWSGVMVVFMGAFWLLQSLGGRGSALAARAWPFLMIPFAIFVAVASDPEVWILGELSLAQALTDPQILEHQIGALLILILLWLGLRDGRRPAAQRPLGYALPAIMIPGSLLLLGHAHSALTGTQELTNLINVQHAVMGACGLFGGTVRWLELRGLFPQRAARILWPACVIALGLFMAFGYREVI